MALVRAEADAAVGAIVACTTIDTRFALSSERRADASAPSTGMGVAALELARTGDSRYVRGSAWRSSTLLQASHWLCGNCDTGVVNALDTCRCGATSRLAEALRHQEARRRLQENVHATSFGRNLLFMAGTAQRHGMPDLVGGYEDDDYGARVEGAVAGLIPTSHKKERSEYLDDGVWLFDAFLALETRGKLSVSDAARTKVYADDGKAAKLMQAFVALHGVTVTARGLDGEMASVQVRHACGANAWNP